MKEETITKIQRLVYAESDLHFPLSKRMMLARSVMEAIKEEGVDDCEKYYDRLVRDRKSRHRLLQRLTTSTTYFFRDSAQFEVLRDVVFPEILDKKNKEVIRSWGDYLDDVQHLTRHPAMSIRVWSCGCSSGEEAYSLVFTMLDSLKYRKAWDAAVIGTDIREDLIMKADRGCYWHESVRDAGIDILSRYMFRVGEGWHVKEYVKDHANFYLSNIKDLTASPDRTLCLKNGAGETVIEAAGYFDIIFCRNVMIYYDKEGQQRLVDALYDCLRPGGYLFTGDSEPLHLFAHGFESRHDCGALYYRKPL